MAAGAGAAPVRANPYTGPSAMASQFPSGNTPTASPAPAPKGKPATRRTAPTAPAPSPSTAPASVAAEGSPPPDEAPAAPSGGGQSSPGRSWSMPSPSGAAGDGAAILVGFLAWVWVILPFVKGVQSGEGGPTRVRNVLRAKLTNKGPNGEPLP